jgi:preprotein translocase subunit SecY
LTKITLPGSVFLALIAAFPVIVITMFQLVFNTTVDPAFSDFFGGTGLLIVVGVALDTLEKVETQLLTRHYDGFLKRGKVRGRRG